jgi:L-tartrate/succinate antiporter
VSGRVAWLPWRWIVPLAVVVVASLLPVPSGLTPNAMRYFALFAGVVAALIAEPLPAAAVGFAGMALAAASRLVVPDAEGSLRWALSGFANGTVWLVFAAFVLAQGYEKTGLGRRIALQLVRTLGGNTLGLGYALMLAEVALAPFTPSNTARSAGVIYPVLRNIPPLYGSEPGPTARRLGAYVMWVAFAATAVTSSMFLTALAPNLLAVGMVTAATGHTITMAEWVKGFLPMAAVLVATVPWLVYKVYPPEVKRSVEVPVWAAAQLAEMGPVSGREWQMAALSIATVLVWVFGAAALEPTTVALIAITLMLLLGIVSWADVTGNRMAWSTLVLLATLVALADGMNKVGFVTWLARVAAQALSGFPALVVMGGLVALFFLVHYFFASLTAHTTAILPVLLAAGAVVPNLPMRPFAMLACYSLGMMGVITPYATGPAPVYYAAGYISRRAFWSLGLLFGLFFLAVLLGIGAPYLLARYP